MVWIKPQGLYMTIYYEKIHVSIYRNKSIDLASIYIFSIALVKLNDMFEATVRLEKEKFGLIERERWKRILIELHFWSERCAVGRRWWMNTESTLMTYTNIIISSKHSTMMFTWPSPTCQCESMWRTASYTSDYWCIYFRK